MKKFLGMVERRALASLKANPGCSWGLVLALVFQSTMQAKASVRTRVRAIRLEEVGIELATGDALPPSIPEVRGDDKRHLEGCWALSKAEGTGVLFLVFESPLQGRKPEIEKAYPGVRISSPAYLETYLIQDASTWVETST